MKRVLILNPPVRVPRNLTSEECANLRAQGVGSSPARMVAADGSESDTGGQLYCPAPQGGDAKAGIYALLA